MSRLERAAQTVRAARMTRLEYDALIERGVLDTNDPIELLEGRLFFRGEHRGTRHEAASIRIRLALDRVFRGSYLVRSGYVLGLSDLVESRSPGGPRRRLPERRAPRPHPRRRPPTLGLGRLTAA
jgi:hypothetical protein